MILASYHAPPMEIFSRSLSSWNSLLGRRRGMARNKDVAVFYYPGIRTVRSENRARYEQALSAAARSIRAAEAQLRITNQDAAADELALLAAWLRSELEASLAGKRPVRIRYGSLVVDASSQTASAQNSLWGMTA